MTMTTGTGNGRGFETRDLWLAKVARAVAGAVETIRQPNGLLFRFPQLPGNFHGLVEAGQVVLDARRFIEGDRAVMSLVKSFHRGQG